MSDLSILSHAYKTNSDLLKKVNDAVVALKRTQYKLPGEESLSSEQVLESQKLLSQFLGAILEGLSPAQDRELKDFMIPSSLTERISEAKKGELEYYISDLEQASDHLAHDLACLTPKDLALLDELATITDAETSSLFRKLWRK